MWLWRIGIGAVIFLLVGLPVLFPFVALVQSPAYLVNPDEVVRVLGLAGNTALLVLGTICISIPAGIFLAAALFRTDLPCRRFLLLIVVSALFLPLPFLTTTWQAVLGEQSWLSLWLWPSRAGQPWASGFLPAICVHAIAALPWVTLLIGLGLRRVESELEEESLLAASPLRVFCRLTMVRCWPMVVIAAAWAAVLTIGEIGVTDMFAVRTFAEEVYLVLNAGGEADLSRILAPILAVTIALSALFALALPFLAYRMPPMASLLRPPPVLPLRGCRWPVFLVSVILISLLVAVPLATMIQRTGYQSDQVGWSLSFFFSGMAKALTTSQNIVAFSLLGAIGVGAATALLALFACWSVVGERGRESFSPVAFVERNSFRLLLERNEFRSTKKTPDPLRLAQITFCSFLALVWLMPGPVVGVGLRSTIQAMLPLADRTGQEWLAEILYYGPSYLPAWWASLVRAFPYAAALLWPVVHLIPREIRESARADGAGPLREFIAVVLPLSLPGVLSAAALTAALALSETSATIIVATPGTVTFSQVLFDRMHYGVTQDVSSLCLLLLVWIFLGIIQVLVLAKATGQTK